MATLLGTHNSGITIADGYGNRDEHFQQYFKWIRWVVSRMPSTYRFTLILGTAARAHWPQHCAYWE